MAVLQDININVYAQPSDKRLRTFLSLSQNENGRLINFRILGSPLPSNCTATFSGTKPDGNVYSKTGTVTGNFVVIEEDIQMTAVAGVWDAKLDIINGTHNIMTALIRVMVDADVVDPDAIASDSQLQGLVAEAKYYAEHARTDAYGSPLTATTAAEMTDKTRVYVYTGSETGMTAGHWYYWNGSAWVSGGVYNAVAVQTDTTLSVAGKAADGKAAGDAIEELKEDLNTLDERVSELEAGGSGGLSMTAVNLFHTILSEAVYGTDQTTNIELLYKELAKVRPVSITAELTSRALVGLAYSALEFEITATFDDESTITTDEGYRVLTSGNVVSGSNTVTVSFRGVTTTVTFTAEQVTTYTITYNLTDVTSSNMTALVVEDDYYSTVLSIPEDYGFDGCTVTMGGVDITATAYSNMEILITEVTGDVVITASATAYTYMDDLERLFGTTSVLIAYSDYLETQISRINYQGTAFVSEYPAISDCNLHWIITNNTDSPVSLSGVCIGSIPCDDAYPPSDMTGFKVPYAIVCTNQSGTLEAGASIEGDYVLRSNHQLVYTAQADAGTGSASKLTLRIRGNYRPNQFSDYDAFVINAETPHYGAYRSVTFYSDNGETSIASINGYKGKLTDTLTAGTYDVYYRLNIDYPGTVPQTPVLAGAMEATTDTVVNYASGRNIYPFRKIWSRGQMTIADDNMTVIATISKQNFSNSSYADFRIKGVTA